MIQIGGVIAQAPGPQSANPVLAFLPLILMFVIFYFLLIRPQQKRQKEHQQMLRELKKGDRIITSGGLIGTVVGLKDDEVVLRVGDQDTKVECLKSAITTIKKP